MPRRLNDGGERARADTERLDRDPATGARRREAFLLGAYVVLFVVGVWTVAAAELGSSEPPPHRAAGVTQPTQSPAPAAP